MSDLILQPGMFTPPTIQTLDQPEEDATAERKAKMIPDPVGWKILCAIPRAEQTFEGTSIVKSDTYMKSEEVGTTVLFVMKVGPLAYMDQDKFPTGPWCKEGDFVLVRTYAGTRFKIYGEEFRILNDDQIEAVVEDPRGITRAAA